MLVESPAKNLNKNQTHHLNINHTWAGNTEVSMLKFNVDPKSVAEAFGEIKEQVEQAVKDGVKMLAASTNAKAHELAAEQLHTTSKKFRDALSFAQIEENVWVVTLNEKMLWREDGKSAGSMIDDLLRNGAKMGKNGRYKSIPFEHGGGPTQNTPKAQAIVNIMKNYLKQQNIPYKKIETGPDGSPLQGKLHKLNIPSPKPSEKASHEALAGLNIYQYPDSGGKVQRHLMTFRVVSDKHKAEGKWFHPGLEGAKILDQSLTFAEQLWETEILPSILDRFSHT